MNLPHLVGLQLILYAVLWALCALLLREDRRAVVHWMGYALVSGISVGLIGLRPDGPDWLTHTGSSVTNVLGLVLARRGAELFLRVPPRDLQHGAMAALGSLALVWIGPHEAAQRVGLASWLNAALIVGAVLSCWQALRREFGLRFCLATAVPVGAIFLINLKLGINALRGQVIHIEVPGLVQALTWSITLVSAAVFNFLFLFLLALRMQKGLHRLATQDALTGLLNRRGMQALVNPEWERSLRYSTTFALISLDVDHFKRVNDLHGHDAGDRVLLAVAQRLQATVRSSDQVSRMGGEEFLVLMPECRAEVEGVALAERLRAALNQTPVYAVPGTALRITASLGVAGVLPSDTSLDDVLRRADAAMYEGKRSGRDRVVLFASDDAARSAGGADAGLAPAVGGRTGE